MRERVRTPSGVATERVFGKKEAPKQLAERPLFYFRPVRGFSSSHTAPRDPALCTHFHELPDRSMLVHFIVEKNYMLM